jgi:midasin
VGCVEYTHYISHCTCNYCVEIHNPVLLKYAISNLTHCLLLLSYAAACLVSVDLVSEEKPLQLYSKAFGGHTFALSSFMPSPQNGDIVASRPYSDPEYIPDFNKDSNPDVVVRCHNALESLMARVTKLLSIFPENEILMAVARVVGRVKRFDIYSTPLGKVMTGLEVILKLAEDWEMHASNRVTLGSALSDVSRIVNQWRQLELQSWRNLLISRERRYSLQARRHWIQIYSIIRNFVDSHQTEQQKVSKSNFVSKAWMWKGIKRFQPLITISHASPVELSEIVKALDTFCLTSPLGEIKERLLILQAFANQMEIETNLATASVVFLARSVTSICNYYTHFLPFLVTKAEEMRRPLEARLTQEVKLAKWDEQTYYAAAQSRGRNHRKLISVGHFVPV